MPITIPRYYTGRREYLSAAVQNSWNAATMTYYAIATARQTAFCRSTSPHNGDYSAADYAFWNGDPPLTAWSGHFLCTDGGINLKYAFKHYAYSLHTGSYTAHTDIKINGAVIVSKTAPANSAQAYSGEIHLAGYVAGTVYKITVESYLTTTETTEGRLLVDPTYIGINHTHTYPPIAAFGPADPPAHGDFSIANLNTISDALNAFGANIDLLPPPTSPVARLGVNLTDNAEKYLWNGTVIHGHNKLHYKLFGATAASGNAEYRIYYGGNLVANAPLPFVSGINSGAPTTSLIPITGTVNITGYGFATGDLVPVYITIARVNTAAAFDAVIETQAISTLTDTAPPAPTKWAHGQDIDFAKLNWHKSILDIIDPAAPAPTAPLFFTQPVIATSTGGYWLRRTAPALHWITDGGQNDITITLDGDTLPLKNIDPAAVASPTDLSTIKDLLIGMYYRVENATYVQEHLS